MDKTQKNAAEGFHELAHKPLTPNPFFDPLLSKDVYLETKFPKNTSQKLVARTHPHTHTRNATSKFLFFKCARRETQLIVKLFHFNADVANNKKSQFLIVQHVSTVKSLELFRDVCSVSLCTLPLRPICTGSN